MSRPPKPRLRIARPQSAYVPAASPRTRILKRGFVVDIVTDPTSDPPIFHVTIQKTGSPEILYWSQERSFQEAEQNAEAFVAMQADRPRAAPD